MPTEPERLIRRRDALAAGYDDSELRRLHAKGVLDPVRRGVYLAAIESSSADPPQPEEKHRVLAYAVHSAAPSLAVSHVSAAAVWGLPLWDVDLTRVHLTKRGGGGGRKGSDIHLHSARIDPDDLVRVNGALVTSVARTLVDIGRAESLSATVVAADFALHERLTTGACLLHVLDECTGQPGVTRARRGLKAADGRSESAGESRTRPVCDQLG